MGIFICGRRFFDLLLQHREKFPVTQKLDQIARLARVVCLPKRDTSPRQSASVGGLIFTPFHHGNPRIFAPFFASDNFFRLFIFASETKNSTFATVSVMGT